jgi:hypothetical protein
MAAPLAIVMNSRRLISSSQPRVSPYHTVLGKAAVHHSILAHPTFAVGQNPKIPRERSRQLSPAADIVRVLGGAVVEFPGVGFFL